MTIKLLTPTTVSIQSEAKFFGLEKGSSDGTILCMTFDVHSDAVKDKNAFRAELFREKLSLDLMALNMERMKGSVPIGVFNARVKAVRENYKKALATFEPKVTDEQPAAVTV